MLASASFGLLQLQSIDSSVLKNRSCHYLNVIRTFTVIGTKLLKFVSFLNDYRLYVKKK